MIRESLWPTPDPDRLTPDQGNCIPRLSPLPAGHTLLGADESELLAPEAAAWYRTGVGKVGYLLQTKPELCFAFSELSRHLINPG